MVIFGTSLWFSQCQGRVPVARASSSSSSSFSCFGLVSLGGVSGFLGFVLGFAEVIDLCFSASLGSCLAFLRCLIFAFPCFYVGPLVFLVSTRLWCGFQAPLWCYLVSWFGVLGSGF
ncbi:hypothetical protein O6H91_19G031500 [Diphasiastrum complanatum]|uniref:Uncharacterized protein n=1 Tax=Diphasiastrum complanatum TaxID=34168 RepID=A0ACC2ATT4_DIPCM|nr:hypothetical protein O6H91_19G031500 [Diphasiastrum complanatum]